MNIAVSKGEKTISTLAKRLFAEASKGSSKTSQKEMEAALLRLNPHLKRMDKLKKGTPILVPEEFRLAPNESINPFRVMAEAFLWRSENAVSNARAMLKERAAQSAELGGRARKSPIRAPKLKKVSASAAAAPKAVQKKQAAALAAQLKALDKIAADLAAFRRRQQR
jgi:hypothetical protein